MNAVPWISLMLSIATILAIIILDERKKPPSWYVKTDERLSTLESALTDFKTKYDIK